MTVIPTQWKVMKQQLYFLFRCFIRRFFVATTWHIFRLCIQNFALEKGKVYSTITRKKLKMVVLQVGVWADERALNIPDREKQDIRNSHGHKIIEIL
jgi:hypothetical protein